MGVNFQTNQCQTPEVEFENPVLNGKNPEILIINPIIFMTIFLYNFENSSHI